VLPPTWTPTQPTAIPTVTEFPTFTPVPAFTPLPTPTEDPLEGLRERFQDSLFSPNGRWVAYRDPEKLRVVNTEDKLRVWTLPCEMFEECSTVYPVLWEDSRTLYFAPAPKSGGAPQGISLVTALARIDVRSGKWELVLPDSDRYYDFAFSPDEDYLAYTQYSGLEAEEPSITAGVLSLVDKKEPQQIFILEGVYAGNIIWSPFKPRFVFVIVDPEKGSGVGYLDVATSYIKYALEIAPRDILLLDWGQDNLVSLEEKDWQTNLRSNRSLNPFSGELIGE
jgi:dipeptidyl aminopeptidase/acylaminoacyl peptidase